MDEGSQKEAKRHLDMGAGVGGEAPRQKKKKTNKWAQKDGPVQGGQRSAIDLDSRGKELFSRCRPSGYEGSCCLGTFKSRGDVPSWPLCGTRWNLGEPSESGTQRLSESKGVRESEVFTAVENRIQSRQVKLLLRREGAGSLPPQTPAFCWRF